MAVLAGAVLALLMLAAVLIGSLTAVLPGSAPHAPACQPHPPRSATDIPSPYLALYLQAGQRYGIGWHLLAAVGKAESDHGRGPGPGITSGTNHAGAAGPMQFLPGTWAAFGVDGDHDGDKDVYDPAAARYLKHEGAPVDIRAALYRYNHSTSYVETVLRQARKYERASHRRDAPTDGSCDSADSFTAGATGAAAARAISFAHAQLGKPYAWGAEGPDAYDCSGLTFTAYHAAGITIPRTSGDQWAREPHVAPGQEQPGDLVFFNTGPGASTTRPGHVGLVIGRGKMIAAPHTGTVVQIQPYTRPTLLGFARPIPRH